MHPMILITSLSSGIVSLNGTFAGEVRPDAPLIRPVSSYGALYIELRPFEKWLLPVSQRITLSNGRIVPACAEDCKSLYMIEWPFGICEIEIKPERIHTSPPFVETVYGGGKAFRMIKNAGFSALEIENGGSVRTFPLPAGAKQPLFAKGDGVMYVSGETETGGKYALVLTEDADSLIYSLEGADIEFMGMGKILQSVSANDSGGHIHKNVWAISGGTYVIERTETVQNPASQFVPLTPNDLAVYVLELIQLGLTEEAARFLSPSFSLPASLTEAISDTVSASAFRFSPPDGRSAVAAMKVIGSNHLSAIPVYYQAEMISGAWKITDMRLN